MILLIDNYDSFVYNLARYVGELGYERTVVRNDAITCKDILDVQPSAILLSPGPCTPDESGICLDLVKQFGSSIPILGVCLGHQCIGQVYGGNIVRATNPVHGKNTDIYHNGANLFKDIPNPFRAARYHSLNVEPGNILAVTAQTKEKTVMAIEHPDYPVFGVQFHPESVLTDYGHKILDNFLTITQTWNTKDVA